MSLGNTVLPNEDRGSMKSEGLKWAKVELN